MGFESLWINQQQQQETYNCKKDEKPSAQKMPINLTDLVSAFVLFGFGISISVTVFLMELFWNFRKRRHIGNLIREELDRFDPKIVW